MSAGSVNRLIQFNIIEASGVTRGFFLTINPQEADTRPCFTEIVMRVCDTLDIHRI
jgi:hypothetical protein